MLEGEEIWSPLLAEVLLRQERFPGYRGALLNDWKMHPEGEVVIDIDTKKTVILLSVRRPKGVLARPEVI